MKRSPLLVALILLAGCGGGGPGSIVGNGGGGQDVSIGSIQARAQSGTPTPLLISSISNLFAMSGATFTHVAYAPPKTLANTRIAFSGPGGNLWTADPSGTNIVQVTSDMNPGGLILPSWSPDAFRILFKGEKPSSYYQFVVGATGYNETQQAYPCTDGPAWSPVSNTVLLNGTDIASGRYQLFTATINGTTRTLLTSDTLNHFYPCWSPTGSKIAFVNGISGDIFTMNADASGVTPITTGGGYSQPTWSPDGSRFLAIKNDGTASQVTLVYLDGTFQYLTSGTTENLHPTWSPDGKKMAFAHRDASGLQQIWIANADGSQPKAVLFGSDGHYASPTWSPFAVPRTMIGTRGLFGSTSKAGFIFSQNGDMVQSFLTFNAPTPGTTTITTQSTGFGGNQTYNISGGGGINSLAYANDLLLAPITVIPGQGFTTATGVIVSMNIVDGHITLALPYAKVTPKMQSKSGGTVYTGQILGVFDGTGHNLAPNGASRVEISSTGKLLSAN